MFGEGTSRRKSSSHRPALEPRWDTGTYLNVCPGGRDLPFVILSSIVDTDGYRQAEAQGGNSVAAARGRSAVVRGPWARVRIPRRGRTGRGLHEGCDLPPVPLQGGVPPRPVRAVRGRSARRGRRTRGLLVHSAHHPVRGAGDAGSPAPPPVRGRARRSGRRRDAGGATAQGARACAAGGASSTGCVRPASSVRRHRLPLSELPLDLPRDVHRAELRPAHGAELGRLEVLGGKRLVVQLARARRIERQTELLVPVEGIARD